MITVSKFHVTYHNFYVFIIAEGSSDRINYFIYYLPKMAVTAEPKPWAQRTKIEATTKIVSLLMK
jgi:hypothetical protein